ncbi:MAG: acylneuraminate cytidylyltransferase [Bacteroidetes bacterium]|nr:acylneuraminate cytidylyltransferase [Bacteroidota bacterium]HET6244696.1 acylneuraminate cytidylyltransferase [Bacteroidia bacterium]
MISNILIVIPARGGSKGIPRKNLRSLAGLPLIYYSINTALISKFNPDVFVTTDDEEIATISKKAGAKIIERERELANDATTLDPVIFDAFEKASKITGKKYDLIITIQPTSPLLRTATLDDAIEKLLEDDKLDTIISACDDTHLTWSEADGKFIPNYKKRLNRQYLIPVFKETGSFLITKTRCVSADKRIGENVSLHLLKGPEAIDIDTYEDWNLCEFYLKRKKILFVVTGNSLVGLGHAYNALSIANEILNHELFFLVDSNSKLAFEKIQEHNYSVMIQAEQEIQRDIIKINPDIVINDILDTSVEYMKGLKKQGYKVINFEDLGKGAQKADLVINAMYPENEVVPNHFFGHKYFCLKNEFQLAVQKQIKNKVEFILISFGGVDPNNYTYKVLKAIYTYCNSQNIKINVIAGLGYANYDTLLEFEKIQIFRNISDMSSQILKSDVVFTSAGRTTFEIASIGVPTIVLCQNQREQTHFFATTEFGFCNLGIGTQVEANQILEVFENLVNDFEKRKYISKLMLGQNLKLGKERVIQLIKNTINQ